MQKIKQFLDKYSEVFDDNNNIKICGRDVTKELIKIANDIEPDISHGDLDDGFMDVQAILNLCEKIKKI